MARKTETITLYMSELLYDVKNKTYLTGRSRQNGNNFEEVANMQASDDEEDENQLLRSIGNAFNQLKTKLSEYIVSTDAAGDNILISNSANLAVTLTMPSNYQQATVKTIATEMGDYIENMTLADWFKITNKADYQEYAQAAQVNLQTIREALNKRVRPTRPGVLGQ